MIDKCHIILQKRYEFQKQIEQLGALVRTQTQLILLTATLPYDYKALLCQRIYFNSSMIY